MSLPTAPTKTGYTFAGWYADSGLTNAFDFGTVLVGDTAIYASWTINSYTLTYSADANGSITGTTPQTVEYLATGTAVSAARCRRPRAAGRAAWRRRNAP